MSYTTTYEHQVTAIRIGKNKKMSEELGGFERRVLVYGKTRTGDPTTISLTLFGPEPINVLVDPDNTPEHGEGG